MDCESSEQFYNLDPDITRTDPELTIENFGRADRERDNFQDDQSPREGFITIHYTFSKEGMGGGWTSM